MNFRKYMGIILNIVVPLAIIYAVCVWGLRLVVFFLPFVIGWIVAMIANPLVRFLERKLKIVRRHGSVILVVGVLGLVIFGFYGLCSWLFQEMTEFVQALPEIYGSVQGEVNQAYARIGGLLKYLPADTENTIGAILENAGGYIGDFVQKIAASAGGRVVRTLPEVFVNAIIICLSSYLFLADHDRIVETVKQFGMEQYEFAVHETTTASVIENVKDFKSEIGVLCENDFNEQVLNKMFKENGLEFVELFQCNTFVYLWAGHPLAKQDVISMEELDEYPCLSFDQGKNSSLYLAEEMKSTYEYRRLIKANDRATLLNLMRGLNAYTLCSGIICEDLNGDEYVAIPLKETEKMKIGYLKRKGAKISHIGEIYVKELKKYKEKAM